MFINHRICLSAVLEYNNSFKMCKSHESTVFAITVKSHKVKHSI